MPIETCEYRSVRMADLQQVEDGAGGFKGYPTTWYDLDEYGDICLPGTYTRTIPEFLKAGFVSESHEWDVRRVIGMPISASEDDKGFFSEAVFHSDEDSQKIRLKANERMARGMDVALSCGFNTLNWTIVDASSFDSELPKWIPAEFLAKLTPQLTGLPYVRLVHERRLAEYSIVTMPALLTAQVSGVTSAAGTLTDDVPYSRYLATVTDAVGELVRRTSAKSGLLTRQGRKHSGATIGQLTAVRDGLKEIAGSMGEHCDSIDAMIADCAPDEERSAVPDALILAARASVAVMEMQLASFQSN